MEENNRNTLRQKSGGDSYKVLGSIAIIMVLAVFAVYMYLAHITGKVISAAEGFKTGKVTTEFHDYVTSVVGNNELLVATLKSTDSFTRRDSKSMLWELIKFPDVVVEVKVPVEYTYYLPLKGDWKFEWDDATGTITVITPALRPGTPAADISAMQIYEKEGSIFRDAEKVKSQLKSEISGKLQWAAQEKIPLIKDAARKAAGEFIRDWFIRYYFKDSSQKPKTLIVLFSYESRDSMPVSSFSFEEI